MGTQNDAEDPARDDDRRPPRADRNVFESAKTHAGDRTARFEVSKTGVFGPLAKTSMDKIQKFVPREKARSS